VTLERNEFREAVEEAAVIIKENRAILVSVTMGTARNIGWVLVSTLAVHRMERQPVPEFAEGMMKGLEEVVPWELIEDAQQGDLSLEVQVLVSFGSGSI